MVCPYCSSKTHVTNSRPRSKGTQVWRRRECKSCKSIWSTHEVIDLSTSHKIEDSKKQLRPFSRDILYVSIKDALSHRKTPTSEATGLTETVISKLLHIKASKLSTKKLFEIAHNVISSYDKTAGDVYKALHNR